MSSILILLSPYVDRILMKGNVFFTGLYILFRKNMGLAASYKHVSYFTVLPEASISRGVCGAGFPCISVDQSADMGVDNVW